MVYFWMSPPENSEKVMLNELLSIAELKLDHMDTVRKFLLILNFEREKIYTEGYSNGFQSEYLQTCGKEILRCSYTANDAAYLASLIFHLLLLKKRRDCWLRGVPIYDVPINYNEATKPRNYRAGSMDYYPERDLTDVSMSLICFGIKFPAGSQRIRTPITKRVSCLWPLPAVKDAGHKLFPDYKTLFTAANEKSDEMIFSIQNIAVNNLGSTTHSYFGSRSAFGSNWKYISGAVRGFLDPVPRTRM
ncbi:hypothetical protein FQR65_LT19051 [Abscondita terminalis]|nr:hypothetical protein FQR65_LT19051 [Abscondita terminalis]